MPAAFGVEDLLRVNEYFLFVDLDQDPGGLQVNRHRCRSPFDIPLAFPIVEGSSGIDSLPGNPEERLTY